MAILGEEYPSVILRAIVLILAKKVDGFSVVVVTLNQKTKTAMASRVHKQWYNLRDLSDTVLRLFLNR
ncbi:MAG: hypothetical protein ACTS73_00965 [Arsenophonus sp. NEOnobi-MAG3]